MKTTFTISIISVSDPLLFQSLHNHTFIYLFIYSFVYLFIYLFICLYMYVFIIMIGGKMKEIHVEDV
jgi:ABC-type arginine transport system permease subunit